MWEAPAMTYKELVLQHNKIEKTLYEFAKVAYAKCLAGDVFLCEQRIDDEVLFAPVPDTKNGITRSNEFEIEGSGLQLVGEWFVGGESAYIRTTIPLDLLDDLNAFIEKKKGYVAADAAARAKEKERERAAELADDERNEREQLARLKAKYESGAPR
jgi:hypothetical protein